MNLPFLKDELLASARRLRRNGRFAATVLLQLSLGIAGMIVVHAILSSMILRPLPFKNQDRLVMLWEENSAKGLSHQRVAPDKFRDWKAQLRSVQAAVAYQIYDRILTPTTKPQRVRTARVSAGYFELFGLTPVVGRTLEASDAAPGIRTAVISESLWKDRFGSDRNIAGSVTTLGEEQYTIVGVVRASAFPANADVLVSLSDSWQSRVAHSLVVVGMLRPSYRVNDCRLELALLSRQFQQAYPDTDTGWSATATSLREEILGDSRFSVELAWGGAFIVLLIACFNVANLTMVRLRGRLGEIAIRTAFGATRFQVMVHFLGELIILGLGATLFGLILANLSLHFVATQLWQDGLRDLPPIAMDWRVVVFSALIFIFSVIAAGVLPATQVSRFSPMRVMQAETRTASRRGRISTVLVVGEVAISACLLVCAGLVIKSLSSLEKVDPGFRTKGITTAEFALGRNKFRTEVSRAQFVDALVTCALNHPAVMDAGVTSSMPLSGHSEPFNFLVEGVAALQHADMKSAEFRAVSPGFLRVMGIPLIEGRFFDAKDGREQPRVALVSSSMARRYWPGASPLGKRISIDGSAGPWREIVGVIGDTREDRLDRTPVAEMYFPAAQETPWTLTLAIRYKGTDFPAAEIQQIFAGYNSEVIPYRTRSADALVSDSLAMPRARGVLLAICALVGVTLAAVGMYSSLAYAVSQRTGEIGIKMSLGATRYHIGRRFALEGLVMTVAGLAIGMAVGLALARTFSSQLYGIHPLDAPVVIAVMGGVLLVGLMACLLPAIRAARIEPVSALRRLG